MINNSLDVFAFLILPIIGTIFFVYICFEFMSKVERNIYRKKYIYILAFILFATITTGIALTGNGMLNLICMIIGMIVIGNTLYNNSKKYILYYLVFINCLFFFDGIVSIGTSIVISSFNLDIKNIAYIQIFMNVFIRVSEYLFAKVFIIFINKRKISKLKLKESMKFLITPIFSVIYISTLSTYLQIYAGYEELILFVINIVLILALNIYVTYIFDNISKNNILQNEVNLYQQHSKLQYEYYDNLEKKYQGSRKLAHDIRNHLNTIEELYKMDDIETAKIYTNDIHKMLNELNQKYYTSNKVLNIILNDKFTKVKNTAIEVDCRVGDIDLGFIKAIDITTIFANLLDNAIEETIRSEKPTYIKIDIDKFNDLIVINIINSLVNKPIKKGTKFKSSKNNHDGLGLENVKKVLDQYEGTMLLDYTDKEFKINIVIPV